MKTLLNRILTYLSVFALLVPMLAVPCAYALPTINDGFNSDQREASEEYYGKYGWDEDASREKTWERTITYTDDEGSHTEDITFQRLAAYQQDYLDDIILTTRKYLGLSTSSGGGNGNSIVAIAESQVGLEDSYEQPAGSNNVKYNTWYYGHNVSGQSFPWCCAFVSWCADQCGLIDSGLFTKTAACCGMYSYLTGTMGFESHRISTTTPMGGSDYTPVPGDIMFFSKDGGAALNTMSFEHIGIIVEVTESGWFAVEGNSGNKVSRNWYDSSSFSRESRVRNGLLVHVEYPAVEGNDGIFNFLVTSMGLTPAAACGVMGNMERESGLNPDATEFGYTFETGAGYGLIQWTNTNGNIRIRSLDSENLLSASDTYREIPGHRRTNLVNWCTINGYDYRTATGQLYFLKYEIETHPTYKNAVDRMNEQPNNSEGAKQCTLIWLEKVEGLPRGNSYYPSESSKRIQNTLNKFWPQYGSES